jgi:hypothetical protein
MGRVDRGSSPSDSSSGSSPPYRHHRGQAPEPPPSHLKPCSWIAALCEAPAVLPPLAGTLLCIFSLTPHRSQSWHPPGGRGERETKGHNRSVAAATTLLPRHHTNSPPRSLPNTGDSHHIELRSGGILLIPFNFTAGVEKKQGSQTLALKIKPNLLLYKSERQTQHPLCRR